MPVQSFEILMYLGRKLLHTTNNELEFPLQRLRLGELVTLGFDMGDTLTQSGHARLEFLFFNQALGIALDEPCQALAELGHLALQGGPLLLRLLAIGVETSGKLLRQAFGMGQKSTHFLPHGQLEAIGPHLGVGTETMAPKAIRIRADTAIIRIGARAAFAGTRTQGFAIEGIATVLTLQQALQQIAGAPLGLTRMATVFLQLLLHGGEHLGLDDGRHGDVNPVEGWHIIVRQSAAGLQRAAPLRPQFGAQGPLPGFPKGRTAHIRGIFQDGPDHTPFPHETAGARPFAGLHEASADLADREPVASHPRKDLAHHPRLLGKHVITRLAATVVLGNIAVAIRRAAEDIDGPCTGGVEFPPAVALDNLGSLIFGHHPLHLQQQIIFGAAS
jgi:hypothetical protein